MKIRSHKLFNHSFGNQWIEGVEDRWKYEDFLNHEAWRKYWISFDGVVYHHDKQLVYLGITSFDADIFKAFDITGQRFLDCNFREVGNAYDAKFHRSMEMTRDGGTLYTATALLHNIDRYWEAPGGGIFQYDVATGKNTKLGIPIPHNYIQSIVFDEDRGLIYSMHFTPECLSVFDIETRQSRFLGPIGSGLTMAQGQNLVLDDTGNVWCGWNMTRAWQDVVSPDADRLCKFDVNQQKTVYLDEGLPRANGEFGTAKVEGLFNFGTGCLYASGDNGSLYRIDPKNGKSSCLGTPIKDKPSRLTSLALHRDGYAYGITGRQGECRLLRFDPRTDYFELGDAIIDETGVALWQCHDIDITPEGVLYAGENDHPQRSSYLWEIAL